MFFDDLFLAFHGFQPSDITRSYLHDKMNALQNEAPYGSNLKATFTRRDNLYQGVITIYSSAGRFFAAASGEKIKEVTRKLIEQIRTQLNRWKKQRFHCEYFDFTPFGGRPDLTDDSATTDLGCNQQTFKEVRQ